MTIPDDAIFIDDGDWVIGGDLWRIFGALSGEDYAYVNVYDESNTLIWTSPLDKKNLDQQGIKCELEEVFDINDFSDVTYYAVMTEEAIGMFFKGKIYLKDEFDPGKLSFNYTTFNGQDYIDTIFYHGQEIESIDYDSHNDGVDFEFCKK